MVSISLGGYVLNADGNGYSWLSINLGTIKSFTETVGKSVSVTPLTSLNMQSSFPLETANTHTYTVQFVHHTGQGELDNKTWFENLDKMVDRWQARRNGTTMTITGDTYYPGDYGGSTNVRGYIKSISRSYSYEYNEIISGTLEFIVGTMYVQSQSVPADAESFNSMSIEISSSDRTKYYTLYNNTDHTCIDSIEIKGGPEQPLEFATIVIPRKKLTQFAPMLEGDLVAMKNRILMNFMGGDRQMILYQSEVGSDNVTLFAYCMPYMYQSSMLVYDMIDYPQNIITDILTDGTYGFRFNDDVNNSQIVRLFDIDNIHKMYIPAQTNVWRVLQICAAMLGCKIFFADGKAYIIDYRKDPEDSSGIILGAGTVDLYNNTSGGVGNNLCIGTTVIDKEGATPASNKLNIKCRSSSSATTADKVVTVKDSESEAVFGTVNETTINMSELIEYVPSEGSSDTPNQQASTFARNLIEYYREPQRSITFALMEAYYSSAPYWKSKYGVVASADRIIDSINGDEVTNISAISGTRTYQRLALSQYTRYYPRGITKYTFGVVKNVSLSEWAYQTDNSL